MFSTLMQWWLSIVVPCSHGKGVTASENSGGGGGGHGGGESMNRYLSDVHDSSQVYVMDEGIVLKRIPSV